ncbi:putative disease resistance RPP13-like protein 1 [Pyrus x bretschneideri]|uniref:putative disease resistance RPP13-like protein 1 n=1 Tax=Pyrus x bretschneideri TaxID=225117 RepID=UPI0020303A47|nr:putative disease resistance RPP13-like protein 1 [Pyrus x bretschneideri]
MRTKFPQGIGQLTCLQTLPYFSVGNEIGRRIEELAGLKQLKGELIVCHLEHVKNGEEAKKAKLEDKTKVRHLHFKWTKDRSTTDNEEEGVLEGLRPHLKLENLSIENFMGDKFPTWMMNGLMKKIELLGCDKCEGVPPLGHLPNLTELNIKGMASLKCVGAEFYGYDLVATPSKEMITLFPKLKVLHISECDDLNEWKQVPTMSGKKLVVFPCLEMLTVKNCSRLKNASSNFLFQKLEMSSCEGLSRQPSGLKRCTSLQKLSIENCDGLSGPLSLGASLLEVSIGNYNGISVPLSAGACLVELTIRNCNNLTSIEIKGSGSLTDSLQKLTICDCRELASLPALPQQCPSLQELVIGDCPKLSSFGVKSSRAEKEEECISLQSTSDLRTMTSLRLLDIYYCERLESWVSSLQFPLSLETLKLCGMPNLHILPSLDHLHSLRTLWIVNWRNLKYLPTGLQWPTGLQTLWIGGFWGELDSFPDFEVGSLTNLTLYGWPKLKSLPQQIQHLTSLTELWIFRIEGVETLPEWLGSLTSLTSLEIQGCKNLKNLPSVQAMQRLTKLEFLYIYGCHPLLEERCRRNSGTDWPKISHIRDFMSKF